MHTFSLGGISHIYNVWFQLGTTVDLFCQTISVIHKQEVSVTPLLTDPDFAKDSIHQSLDRRLTLPAGKIVTDLFRTKGLSNDLSTLCTIWIFNKGHIVPDVHAVANWIKKYV